MIIRQSSSINNLKFYVIICEIAEQFYVQFDELYLYAIDMSITVKDPIYIRRLQF